MASPIQVVLDPGNFIHTYDRPPGGGLKDLYAGRNRAFRLHRDALVSQVQALERSTIAFMRSRVAVASIDLVADALAKSNRPSTLLRNLAPMGSARGGELLVQVTSDDLSRLAERIADAPLTVPIVERINSRTGEVTEEDRPTPLRCDVGAIERISLWTPERRLLLTVEQVQRWLEQPGTPLGLIVQLFQFDALHRADADRELKHLQGQLHRLGCEARYETLGAAEHAAIYLQVTLAGSESQAWQARLTPALALMRDSFLVRSITVPARMASSASSPALRLNQRVPVTSPHASAKYPIVGVIDGGIATPLANWVKATERVVSRAHGDENHGTYIGGLLVLGQTLNGSKVASESDGCELIDICMVPSENDRTLFKRYFSDTTKFMDELDRIVGKLRTEQGVRVFNFSLNLSTPGRSSDYNYETRRLDEIARKHDVVFVISAGNLPPGGMRAEWPADDVAALQALALARNDQIECPAESMTNISVAAVNSPDVAGFIERMPTAYSRRGPSAFGGVKPDVAHYGGCAVPERVRSGLLSLSPTGVLISECGTSYATPMVAKTIARYPMEIDGALSREMMIALLVHHAQVPDRLRTSAFEALARDFVGFGVPQEARVSLDGSPHAVTIVFEEKIPKRKRLEFDFTWPASLTDGGRCRGRGRLTLVARPLLDSTQGHEIVRTQLDGHVMQLGTNGKKKGGHFHAGHMPKILRGKKKLRESELIRHALKWSPIKSYHFKAPKGVGESSNWRLTVEALERTPGETPPEGTHFVAILTIEDIEGQAPVFDEMRASLSLLTRIADIRSAARVRNRARAAGR
jgi:hypothetical protein